MDTTSPEVITYRLQGKLVYVPPASSYEVGSKHISNFDHVLTCERLDLLISKPLTSHNKSLQMNCATSNGIE
jgi:hypothetical protein